MKITYANHLLLRGGETRRDNTLWLPQGRQSLGEQH
jgi:hypothetical protein